MGDEIEAIFENVRRLLPQMFRTIAAALPQYIHEQNGPLGGIEPICAPIEQEWQRRLRGLCLTDDGN
jgi:hypothetical protein